MYTMQLKELWILFGEKMLEMRLLHEGIDILVVC